jgi:hypothetical protein
MNRGKASGEGAVISALGRGDLLPDHALGGGGCAAARLEQAVPACTRS